MHIKIPDQRAEQLKSIAAIEGCSVSDLISSLVNSAIKAGLIPDETPGFIILGSGKRVLVNIDGDVRTMTSEQALAAASTLERCLDNPGLKMVDLDAADWFECGRVGNGLYVTIGIGKEANRQTFAPSVARDIVRQLKNAATKATSKVA